MESVVPADSLQSLILTLKHSNVLPVATRRAALNYNNSVLRPQNTKLQENGKSAFENFSHVMDVQWAHAHAHVLMCLKWAQSNSLVKHVIELLLSIITNSFISHGSGFPDNNPGYFFGKDILAGFTCDKRFAKHLKAELRYFYILASLTRFRKLCRMKYLHFSLSAQHGFKIWTKENIL